MIGSLSPLDRGWTGWVFSSPDEEVAGWAAPKGSLALVLDKSIRTSFGNWLVLVLCCGKVGWIREEALGWPLDGEQE